MHHRLAPTLFALAVIGCTADSSHAAPAADSFFALRCRTLDGSDAPMAAWSGDAMLVVNLASA
jgi:hypothetical protein